MKKNSQSTKKEEPEYIFKDEECEIGIDEAGRGPVLGPMVYSCAFWPMDVSNEMKKKYGFADSKQLTEEQREDMFVDIKKEQYKRLGFFNAVLMPDYLSNTMLAENKNGGKNLNNISHDTAIDLINKVKALGVNVKRVVLDTVGQPEAYKRLLKMRLNDEKLEIIVESKADANFPVVSAASICAKVTRDHVLADWKYKEQKQIDKDYGCGYPSDPKTKEWLRRNGDLVFGFPNIVRFSWKTCYSILEENKSMPNWFDDVIDDGKKQQKLQFSKTQNSLKFHTKTPSQKERDSNFAIRGLGLKRSIQL